jgi:exodeoxyribonuclease VII large subunit
MADSVNILTVSELNSEINYQLSNEFSSLFVVGEVSGLYRPQSGHLYFNLKDSQSQIRAVIWRSDGERIFRNNPFELRNGQSVICGGGVSVFSSRGEYQLNVRSLQPYGEGPRELALRQLKEKLEQAGLFELARKRSLPRFPRRIAVITSPTGAAIRDFLHVLRPRWPHVEVIILPVKVQGEGATNQIAYALNSVARFEELPDVVVLTRGGGSIEDLWSFNEEAVCRAVYSCAVPVVCGVGHEIDVTLADFVADVRALTPSDAALKVVPSQTEIRKLLHQLKNQLVGRLEAVYHRACRSLESLMSRPAFSAPLDRVRQQSMELDRLQAALSRAIHDGLRERNQSLQAIAGRLNAINPVAVLARGYSVTSDSNGKLITDSGQVNVGDQVMTRLAKGNLLSRVEEAR